MAYKTNQKHRERIDSKLRKIAELNANHYEYNIDKYPKSKRTALAKKNQEVDKKVGMLYQQIKSIDPQFYSEISI